jgi:hypothetical protein
MDDYRPLALDVHTLPEAIEPIAAPWCPRALEAVAALATSRAVAAVVASRAVVAI